MKKIKGILICLLLTLSPLWAEETPVQLHSDYVSYNEDTRLLLATSNVHLSYGEIDIAAENLTLDVDNNLVWGHGKIKVKRGEDEFNTNGIMMNLDSKVVTINDISVAIIPPEEMAKGNKKKDQDKQKLYIKAKTLVDTPEHKHGEHGLVTACNNPDHYHHYVWAQKFKYYPNKRIKMYNVVFHNKLLFIPIYFWLPYYSYELGKRKVVWNFPTIGRKDQEGWGYFVQNQIDYNYDPTDPDKESSIFIDWYEAKDNRQGEWGGGIRHYYKDISSNDGMLYYYNYDFREKEDDQWVDKFNKKISWENSYKKDDLWTIDHYYESIDLAQKINTRGSSKRDKKGIKLIYDDLGDKYVTSYDETQDFNLNRKSSEIKQVHTFNNRDIYSVNYKETETFNSNREDISSKGKHTFYFPNDLKLSNEYTYSSLDSDWTDDTDPDTQLKTYTTFHKQFNEHVDMSVKWDQIFDLDRDTVTTDVALNNFLHKVPEVNINFKNYKHGPLTLKQETTIARYQETRYDRTTEKVRKFPDDDHFTFAPNTYIFKQNADFKWTDLPFKTTFKIGGGYDQYIFETEDKNVTNGDALYNLKFNTSQQSEFLKFIKMDTRYQSQYAPVENGSPFFEFDKQIQEKNEISETLTFFYKRNNLEKFPYFYDFSWSHSTDYSWIREEKQWGKYTTKVKMKVTKKFTTSASLAKKLNFSRSEAATRFDPLRFDFELNPTKNIGINYDIAIDFNKYRDEDITELESSKINLAFKLGKNPEYQWEIKAGFVYDTSKQEGEYNPALYEMQTINIVKHEHKRKLEIGYKKLTEEMTFKYTINAFPNDPLELKKEKDIWKVEGRFNEKSEERLQ